MDVGISFKNALRHRHGGLFKRHNPGLCSMSFQRPQYVNIVLLTGTEDDLGYKDYLLGLSNRWQKRGAVPWNELKILCS
jgi:hypothetical protein